MSAIKLLLISEDSIIELRHYTTPDAYRIAFRGTMPWKDARQLFETIQAQHTNSGTSLQLFLFKNASDYFRNKAVDFHYFAADICSILDDLNTQWP